MTQTMISIADMQKGGTMVKVFTPNKNGKIEFTKEELEALLNEVWNDGYNRQMAYYWGSPTPTSPGFTFTPNGMVVNCGQ